MISVLIPVYNYNVSNLVHRIHNQISLLNINFEIICINDASTKCFEENLAINKLQNTYLYNLEFNVGRSKIRNLLAEKSKFNWLLFLDADVLPKASDFINTYVNCLKENLFEVYNGGIDYEDTKPNQSRLLRWVYGKNREVINVQIREKMPYQYFLGANFLINKSAFNSIKFNESIIKYGYEDVLFVEELRRKCIDIKQIDNAVIHLGIEESEEFLSKTKEALFNLQILNLKKLIDGKFIKIIRTYDKINFFKLTGLFSFIYIIFNKIFELNLKSRRPSMFIFDLYKISFFCNIN